MGRTDAADLQVALAAPVGTRDSIGDGTDGGIDNSIHNDVNDSIDNSMGDSIDDSMGDSIDNSMSDGTDGDGTYDSMGDDIDDIDGSIGSIGSIDGSADCADDSDGIGSGCTGDGIGDCADGDVRRIRKGERSRMRILDAAARLLACRGYATTTLTDIASAAEMQAGSLYYHFDSKDAIVAEVLRVGIKHAREAIGAALEPLGDEASGADRLAEAMVAYVSCIVAESSFTVANIRCYSESPPCTREGLAVPLREFINLWVGLLDEGQQDGSLRRDTNSRVLARMMVAGLNSVARWYRPSGELRLDQLSREYAQIVLNGLRTDSADSADTEA